MYTTKLKSSPAGSQDDAMKGGDKPQQAYRNEQVVQPAAFSHYVR